ncbi:MAG: hypothetical protein AAGF07_03320 [Patescibacteria group bacterium]
MNDLKQYIVNNLEDREITNSEVRSYYTLLYFSEVVDLNTIAFRKRLKKVGNFWTVQLRYRVEDEEFYKLALEKTYELKEFWKVILCLKDLKIILSLSDCCWQEGKKVCLGCAIGKNKFNI